jgi:hypothetical protein
MGVEGADLHWSHALLLLPLTLWLHPLLLRPHSTTLPAHWPSRVLAWRTI